MKEDTNTNNFMDQVSESSNIEEVLRKDKPEASICKNIREQKVGIHKIRKEAEGTSELAQIKRKELRLCLLRRNLTRLGRKLAPKVNLEVIAYEVLCLIANTLLNRKETTTKIQKTKENYVYMGTDFIYLNIERTRDKVRKAIELLENTEIIATEKAINPTFAKILNDTKYKNSETKVKSSPKGYSIKKIGDTIQDFIYKDSYLYKQLISKTLEDLSREWVEVFKPQRERIELTPALLEKKNNIEAEIASLESDIAEFNTSYVQIGDKVYERTSEELAQCEELSKIEYKHEEMVDTELRAYFNTNLANNKLISNKLNVLHSNSRGFYFDIPQNERMLLDPFDIGLMYKLENNRHGKGFSINGRLHSPGAMINKRVMSKLCHTSGKLVQLDMHASQPTIWLYEYRHLPEVQPYRDAIADGKFWDYLVSKGFSSKEYAKKLFMPILFGKRKADFNTKWWARKILAQSMPTVFDDIVKVSGATLAIYLQSKEAELVCSICEELYSLSIPFITRHDAIIVPEQYQDIVKDIAFKKADWAKWNIKPL